MRVTVICPQSLAADTEQYFRCLALGADSVIAFAPTLWRDPSGAIAVAASFIGDDGFPARLSAVPDLPDWAATGTEIDLEAAQRVYALRSVWQADGVPVATPSGLTGPVVILGIEGADALSQMGLTAVIGDLD